MKRVKLNVKQRLSKLKAEINPGSKFKSTCRNTSAPLQKRILDKASPKLMGCLCDCAHNVLQENVNISRHHKQKLKPHMTKLRKLADHKVALKTKQRIYTKRWIFTHLVVCTRSSH